MENKEKTDLYVNISDNDEPKYYGEIEIHETMDAPEETINFQDLNNKINH